MHSSAMPRLTNGLEWMEYAIVDGWCVVLIWHGKEYEQSVRDGTEHEWSAIGTGII